MPKISVKKSSSLPAEDIFTKVKGFLSNDEDLRKLDPAFQCTFDEAKLTGRASGKMFKADMTISKEAKGSTVEIIVDLPITLSLVKGMIEKTLQKKLDKHLA